MSVSNIIEVTFGSSTLVFTQPFYKYNSGMYYQFTDLDLPESYQVHFSNSPSGTSIESVGTSDGVLIPDDVWQSGATIYAWIYLHPTETSGLTKYEVRTPVSGRADLPDGVEPSEQEQTVIDQAITALNSAVTQTAQDVQTTTQKAQEASDSADDAQGYANTAQGYANDASGYAQTASTKASEASTSATNASTSEDDARTYAQNASTSEGNAQTYADNAAESARQAQASANSASGYATSASSSASTATSKAREASASAQTASDKASEASTSASTASAKATESAQSATNASRSAQTAEQAKTDAQTAQGVAESARDEAVTAKNGAVTAKESVDALVGDLAKEQTQKQIESGTDELVTLMRQIVEEGQSAGDLNGFSLSLGAGNEVVLTYTDEETQKSVSAVAVTNTTGLAIASAFEDLANTWKEAVTNGNS